jgi:hypothetical protein
VRVTLIGVPGLNQSRLLVQQADQQYTLPEAFWRAHFDQVSALGVVEASDRTIAVAPARPYAIGPVTSRPTIAPASGFPAMRAALEAAASRGGEAPLAVGIGVAAEAHAFEDAARQAGIQFAKLIKTELAPFELDVLKRESRFLVTTTPDSYDLPTTRSQESCGSALN